MVDKQKIASDADILAARKRRNFAIFTSILLLSVLFFIITIIRTKIG